MRPWRTLLPPLLALALAAGAAAQRVDFLDGELNDRPLCELTRAELIDELGIPSRVARDGERGPLRLIYGHLGLDFSFRDPERLDWASVSAVPNGELRPYAGHFLGPVASDTTRGPVLRLLRAARAELADEASDLVAADLDDHRLELVFWEDYIMSVELSCPEAR